MKLKAASKLLKEVMIYIMQNLPNDRGVLIVNVGYGEKAYPLENAMVSVLQKKEDALEIISVTQTDESGKSEPIVIETPRVELSLTPAPDSLPYAKVTIDVEKEGFYKAQFIDVPVFSGVVSVQNVNLIPHPLYLVNNFYNNTVYTESEAPNL